MTGICFDHDHATGAPRGWLCDRCNKVLGLVQDRVALLIDMAVYIKTGGKSAQHGSPAEKARVSAKVHAKYPNIGKD